jgi:hypothetical protein
MGTLIKILEKLGEGFVLHGWMYGVPMPRPPSAARSRRGC